MPSNMYMPMLATIKVQPWPIIVPLFIESPMKSAAKPPTSIIVANVAAIMMIPTFISMIAFAVLSGILVLLT